MVEFTKLELAHVGQIVRLHISGIRTGSIS